MIRSFVIAMALGTGLVGGRTNAAESWFVNGDFSGWESDAPTAWKLCSQRAEIAPELTGPKDDGGRTWARLASLPNGLSMGWLEQKVDTPKTGEDLPWLQFSCRIRLEDTQGPVENARVVLKWEKVPGGKGWRPNRWFFVPITSADGGGEATADMTFPILTGSPGITVMLIQYGGTSGAVSFADIRLTPIPAPKPRHVKLATAYYVPKGRGDWARNLAGVERLTAQAAEKDCDLVLFGEGLSVVGTGRGYAEVAKPIPGPHSDALAEVARKHGIFLAAGLYEQDGQAYYNTAVLFDRKGRLIGKYRKVHLPFPELYGGLQPGDEFPVFDTELGRIGLQVCYDHHFVESARNLAMNGAEIILTPIWGDMRSDGEVYESVARSRAVDNGVFYVTSIYSNRRSLIVDPHGRILAETSGDDPSLAIADLDLDICKAVNQPYRVPANFQINYPAERRPSAYGPLVRPQLPGN